MAFSTMYTASTGLIALGTGMQTISNNLANVNTVGYKAMRTNYRDLISECYYSGNNHNQVGKGSSVNTIQTIFNQGSFKATEQDTDMAIAGDGFFSVRNYNNNQIMYTRAGSYTLTKEGYMEDPSKNILQGWQMSIPKAGETPQRMGTPTDVKITAQTVPPVATSSIKMAVNLNADDDSAYYYPATEGGDGEEGLGYAGAWNGQAKPPISTDHYTHSEPMTVYDEAGTKHDLMIYYQPNPHMENVWDYIITCDPSEDARVGQDSDKASFAGLLQKGKITFVAKDDEAGHGGMIKSIEAQNIDLGGTKASFVDAPSMVGDVSSAMSTASIGGYFRAEPVYDASAGTYAAAERTYTLTWGYQNPVTGEWQANTNTQPPTSAITWTDDAGNTGVIPVSDKSYAGPYSFGSGLTVSFDNPGGMQMAFGEPGQSSFTVTARGEEAVWGEASLSDGHFQFDLSFFDSSGGQKPPYPSDAKVLNQTVTIDMGAKSAGGNIWIPDENYATTQYATKSSVTRSEQDGYPECDLKRVSVREDGMIVGTYSHGREVELFQVSMTRFFNPWALSKQGNNLFAYNDKAGEARTSAPGENGAGTVLGNFLEQSTVDTATEIVQMIMTQRGFQANSKAITTTDTMLATAIQTKK